MHFLEQEDNCAQLWDSSKMGDRIHGKQFIYILFVSAAIAALISAHASIQIWNAG